MGHWQGRHGPGGAQGPGWRGGFGEARGKRSGPGLAHQRRSPSAELPPTPGRGRLGALDRGEIWPPGVPGSRGQRGHGRPRRAAQPLTLPLAVPPLTPIRKGRW